VGHNPNSGSNNEQSKVFERICHWSVKCCFSKPLKVQTDTSEQASESPVFDDNRFLFSFFYSVQITTFVMGLFSFNKDLVAFKNHLRDFLVQLKVRANLLIVDVCWCTLTCWCFQEFSSGNNEDLYLEEKEAALQAALEQERKKAMSIPGLLPQAQHPEWNDMND
jgi:hypothetical protein